MKKLFIATLFAVGALSLFAVDAPSLQPAQGFISPLAEWTLASPFGERNNPITGARQHHNGIDMAMPTGTPILATESGTVSAIGYSNIYGNYVIINHGNGYQSLYGHMSKILTGKDENVGQGTQIGLVGNTGYSITPHLHFVVYKEGKLVDPLPLLASTSFGANNAQKTPQIGAIVIDPGHGGADPGAAATQVIDGKQITLIEKDITYSVASDLCALLKEKYPGKTIQLTRTDDRYLSLQERAASASTIPLADNEIILHISLHVNASANKNSSGFEVWYLPEQRRVITPDSSPNSIEAGNTAGAKSMENMLLAQSLFDGLNASIGSEMVPREIKTEGWYVVPNLAGASALVEIGFLSNPHDAQLLSDPEFINKSIQGLSNGISSFIAQIETHETESPQKDIALALP